MDGDLDIDDFVRSRWPALVKTAMFLGANTPDAEDLAQTALMRCVRAWRKLSVANDPDAYLHSVLVRCFYRGRARRWVGEVPASDRLPALDRVGPDMADGLVLGLSLRQALLDLPVQQRAVLVLRFYADLSEQQVASVLSIPLGTVKSRTSRGLKQMQARLTVGDRALTDNTPIKSGEMRA